MKKVALILAVLFCFHLFHHRGHRHANACDGVVAAPVYSSFAYAPAFAYAQPVVVAQPFYGVNQVAVVNRRANVVVNAGGADVRVRRGAFGSTVVRVR